MTRGARTGVMIAAIASLAFMRPLLPFHAPLLWESFPVIDGGALAWHGDVYVLDARSGGADGSWPHLDERHWDEGLARIIGDGAFAAPIVVLVDAADHARMAQILSRLARELPEARIAMLLGGAGAVPAGYRWRRNDR